MKILSQELISTLQSRKKKDSWLEEKSGGIHLWGTFGFDVIIFPDGKLQSYEWKDGDDRNGKLSDITDPSMQYTCLRVAAHNIPEVKEIIPEFIGEPCQECTKLVDDEGIFMVCKVCEGKGKIQ